MSKKKLLFSLLITAVLLFSISVMSVSAEAADDAFEAVSVSNVDELENAIADSDSASIKLSDDITVYKEISTAADSVAIDLDGHTLATANEGTVKIADCQELSVTNGTIKLDGENNMFTLNSNDANVNIKNVAIDAVNANADVFKNEAKNHITSYYGEDNTSNIHNQDDLEKYWSESVNEYTLSAPDGWIFSYYFNKELKVSSGREVVIHLNGHRLSPGHYLGVGHFIVDEGAKLIIDGTVDGSKIVAAWGSGDTIKVHDIFKGEGTVILNGGTYAFDTVEGYYDKNEYKAVNIGTTSSPVWELQKIDTVNITLTYAGLEGVAYEDAMYDTYHVGDRFDARAYSKYVTDDGKVYDFVSWTKDGVEISTSPIYSFDVEGPVTLVANYQERTVAETEKPDSSVAVVIEAYNATTIDGTADSVRVDAHYIIKGDDYTIKEVGIIYTTDLDAKEAVEAIADDPTPLAANSNVKVRSITDEDLSRTDAGQITVNLAVRTDAAKAKTIYARAYILVTDSNGDKKYIYTNLVTTTYNNNKNGFEASMTVEPKIGGN